jgi:hypothetical protein
VGADQGPLGAGRSKHPRPDLGLVHRLRIFSLDLREYIPVNYGMLPPFDVETLEETERHIVYRHANGIVTRALKDGESRGMRSSMDEYIDFPVHDRADFRKLKKRFDPHLSGRYPSYWQDLRLPAWKDRQHVLVLGAPTAPPSVSTGAPASGWAPKGSATPGTTSPT